MKVSIVTPTWNRSRTLALAIESVEAQSPPPFRHVIVDNLSEDDTPDLVQSYQRRAPYSVVHLRERDSGIYDAMNKGSLAAGGEALYFLNDDDRLLAPDSLRLLAKALALAPHGVAFANVWVEESDSARRLRNHRQMNRLTLAEKSICQQATLYSRLALEAVGPFDHTLRAAGDYDWMIRALVRQSIRGVYLRRAVAVFAKGGISSDPAHAMAFRAEMNSVARRHFSGDVRARALRYRRVWRKLRVISRIALRTMLVPDPLAFFDF
jgi:glycosyltransferase